MLQLCLTCDRRKAWMSPNVLCNIYIYIYTTHTICTCLYNDTHKKLKIYKTLNASHAIRVWLELVCFCTQNILKTLKEQGEVMPTG